MIFAGVWISTGLSVVVLSAAYKAVPAEIHEAGRIDGANAWQLFWRVSLPMLSGPVTFIAVTMIINALKMIDLVLVMTKGAPRGATRIIGYTVFWETFNNNRTGYGSAVAVILLILVMPFHHLSSAARPPASCEDNVDAQSLNVSRRPSLTEALIIADKARTGSRDSADHRHHLAGAVGGLGGHLLSHARRHRRLRLVDRSPAGSAQSPTRSGN